VTEYDADAFDAFEAAGWATAEAGAYDSFAGRVTSRIAEPLLDSVRVRPGTRLLDVATGPGYVAARAAERGAHPVGVDLSEAMLVYARSRVPGVEFLQGDATALPFPDESFDAVAAAFVLLHLSRPERAAAEAARVLVSHGRVAFTVWDEPSRNRWQGVMLEAIALAGADPPADLPLGPSMFRFADEGAFTELLTGAGLEDVSVETFDFTLPLANGDDLWRWWVEESVRVRPLVERQTEKMQRTIRAHFDDLLDEHRVADGFEVPVAVKLASGGKP
jgi:ubiquinone/menaquinone biosynthesis C-methylase UbiE